MKINYKSKFVSQNIDIKKLRPGNSYGSLIKNKNKSFSFLFKKIKLSKKILKIESVPTVIRQKVRKF